MNQKYQEHIIRDLVAKSASFRQVLIALGKAPVGGNSCHLRAMCEKWNIDTSHMTGQAHNRGKRSNKKKDPVSRLVLRTKLQGRQEARYLREGLVSLGREEKCEDCGITNQWNGKHIRLEIDHKDGQFWNDMPDNLRFLCPNCHSQYPTR